MVKINIPKILKLIGSYFEEEPSERELANTQKIEAQTWLADFQTSRSQIQDYQRMQHNLIWINTSAAGVVLTAAIALKSATMPLEYFILTIPLISGLLGIYWVSLGIKTITVSNYICSIIAPRLRILVQNSEVIGLEAYFREKAGVAGKIKTLNLITIPAATAGLTFVIFCVAGLVISGTKVLQSNEWGLEALWWLSSVLTLILVLYGSYLGIHFRSKP